MATKAWATNFLDVSLQYVIDYTDTMCLCSSEPTNYSGALAVELASTSMSSSDFSGPLDGATSGRRITVGEKESVTVDSSGTGRYLALLYSSGGKLLYVARIDPLAVSTGGSGVVDIASWDIELRDAF